MLHHRDLRFQGLLNLEGCPVHKSQGKGNKRDPVKQNILHLAKRSSNNKMKEQIGEALIAMKRE